MKNLITVLLFVLAFNVNANAQTAKKEVKKEACCAVSSCSKKTASADNKKCAPGSLACATDPRCKTACVNSKK